MSISKRFVLCLFVFLIGIILGATIILAAEEGSSFETYCKAQYGSLDTCRKEIAFKRDDPSYCRAIETVATRNSCYM